MYIRCVVCVCLGPQRLGEIRLLPLIEVQWAAAAFYGIEVSNPLVNSYCFLSLSY